MFSMHIKNWVWRDEFTFITTHSIPNQYMGLLADELRRRIGGGAYAELEPSLDSELDETDLLHRVTLITEEGCHGCTLVKTYLQEEIDQGAIQICDLKDEKCRHIADALKIKEVPAIIIESDNSTPSTCEIKTEGDDFIFSCPYSSILDKKSGGLSKKAPRHGKLAVSCLSSTIKNSLGYQIQAHPEHDRESLKLLASLPECEGSIIGFAEVKKGSGATEKSQSARGNFMRTCLSGSTGEPQPLRMKGCSEEWKEMDEKEKKKYS